MPLSGPRAQKKFVGCPLQRNPQSSAPASRSANQKRNRHLAGAGIARAQNRLTFQRSLLNAIWSDLIHRTGG
jgi:hypothetical protein